MEPTGHGVVSAYPAILNANHVWAGVATAQTASPVSTWTYPLASARLSVPMVTTPISSIESA